MFKYVFSHRYEKERGSVYARITQIRFQVSTNTFLGGQMHFLMSDKKRMHSLSCKQGRGLERNLNDGIFWIQLFFLPVWAKEGDKSGKTIKGFWRR